MKGGCVRRTTFNTEGRLPDDKHFYAIKVGKLRAYGWFSSRHKGVFFISHFCVQKRTKACRKGLKPSYRKLA